MYKKGGRMSYINPDTVRSPRGSVSDLKVIFDAGEGEWSVAELAWDGEPSLGIRWNGTAENVGTPQSRGIPTWFILPPELHVPVREAVVALRKEAK
jgi:hypothetical protein